MRQDEPFAEACRPKRNVVPQCYPTQSRRSVKEGVTVKSCCSITASASARSSSSVEARRVNVRTPAESADERMDPSTRRNER